MRCFVAGINERSILAVSACDVQITRSLSCTSLPWKSREFLWRENSRVLHEHHGPEDEDGISATPRLLLTINLGKTPDSESC